MQILCNVSLILAGKKPAKAIKLASIDIQEQVIAQSNQLDRLDDSASLVASRVLSEFKKEHPELEKASLIYSVTVRTW